MRFKLLNHGATFLQSGGVFRILLEWSMDLMFGFSWNPMSFLFTGVSRVLFASQVILFPAIVVSSPRAEPPEQP